MKYKIEYKASHVDGFQSAGIHCGIKKNNLKDLGLIYCPAPSGVAGVFTQNVTKAAPVTLSENHLSQTLPKAILINSGNANACTGIQGSVDALKSAECLAKQLGINTNEVLVSSTGIIGVPLPMQHLGAGILKISTTLTNSDFEDVSTAIMTTDTYSKSVTATFTIDGREGRITGIAKGSGMIHPNMATMLGFMMTDVQIDSDTLQSLLSETTNKSFNMISVDGDTSTNDMVLAMASGAKHAPKILSQSSKEQFQEVFHALSVELAKLIASDGEGATKLLEMTVKGARSYEDAAKASKSVISSSLVKAAFFGKDANWGRIICAMGYSGALFEPDKVDLQLKSENGILQLMKNGSPLSFNEDHALDVLSPDTILIQANLNDGAYSATAWGCDLTYDYVKINAEYRS